METNKNTTEPTYAVKPILARLQPCSEARAWISAQRHVTFEDAWNACPDGSWMIWLADRAGVSPRRVVRATCDCLAPLLEGLPKHHSARRAVKMARRWAAGRASTEEYVNAAYKARDDNANRAFYHLVYAADAHLVITMVAEDADAAVVDAVSGTSCTQSLARSAEHIRARIPWWVMEAAMIKYARSHNCLVELTP